MNCKKCGAFLESYVKFCPKCGTPVMTSGNANVSSVGAQANTSNGYAQSRAQNPRQQYVQQQRVQSAPQRQQYAQPYAQQQYTQPYTQQQYTQPAKKKPDLWMGILALVFGFLGGYLGVIFAISGIRSAKQSGYKALKVMCTIAIPVCFIAMIVWPIVVKNIF